MHMKLETIRPPLMIGCFWVKKWQVLAYGNKHAITRDEKGPSQCNTMASLEQCPKRTKCTQSRNICSNNYQQLARHTMLITQCCTPNHIAVLW